MLVAFAVLLNCKTIRSTRSSTPSAIGIEIGTAASFSTDFPLKSAFLIHARPLEIVTSRAPVMDASKCPVDAKTPLVREHR